MTCSLLHDFNILEKKRTHQPLVEEIIDTPQDDTIETVKSDYVDALNDVLSDKRLSGIFKGFADATRVLEIVDVNLDSQQSHIIAYWRSPFVDALVKSFPQNLPTSTSSPAARVAAHINEITNKHEGKIRSALMQRGHFRVRSNGYSSRVNTLRYLT